MKGQQAASEGNSVYIYIHKYEVMFQFSYKIVQYLIPKHIGKIIVITYTVKLPVLI